MEVAILLRESAVAKSTPGAMGNRETRSGEFCRGMTLFMSYFSGTVAKLAMRQPFVLFKGLTFQKLCLP
ncbi:hypothetical protein, partial [Escherichia coli]|uniref:hypothetical protein n=1 Tax=Escherichia coli TaxID=562 RepID=UPI001FCE40FF